MECISLGPLIRDLNSPRAPAIWQFASPHAGSWWRLHLFTRRTRQAFTSATVCTDHQQPCSNMWRRKPVLGARQKDANEGPARPGGVFASCIRPGVSPPGGAVAAGHHSNRTPRGPGGLQHQASAVPARMERPPGAQGRASGAGRWLGSCACWRSRPAGALARAAPRAPPAPRAAAAVSLPPPLHCGGCCASVAASPTDVNAAGAPAPLAAPRRRGAPLWRSPTTRAASNGASSAAPHSS